jgi:hypothetical protein
MKSIDRRFGLSSCLLIAAMTIATQAFAAGPVVELERVSLANDGTQGLGDSTHPVISADGRYVAFQTSASLVPTIPNAVASVVVRRDRMAHTTQLSSVGVGNVAANGYSQSPAMSADGRFVAFTSLATNLVAGDSASGNNIFVHDMTLGTTVRASVNAGGVGVDGGGFIYANEPVPTWISADGRYVVFDSYSKLTPNATNDHIHIYRRDLQTNTTQLVDVNHAGNNADGDAASSSISADGRYVLFASYSGDVVTGLTFAIASLYVRDMVLGVTTSITPDLSTGMLCADGTTGDLFAYDLSSNARFVTFDSNCAHLAVGQDVNDHWFIRDLLLGVTKPLRLNDNGTTGANVVHTDPSDSGRYVIASSPSKNIVASPAVTGSTDIYLRDTVSARTYLISARIDSGAPGNAGSELPLLGKGGRVVFHSYATNLVDGDTNGYADIFVATLDALFASGFE